MGLLILIFAIILIFVFLLVQIPINIAKNRGITGSELTTIAILSWCGLFYGITWFIALGLALLWHSDDWVSKDEAPTDLERLKQLSELHKNKVISDKEYKKLRKEILAD